MSAADVADSVSHWPYLPTLIRLALAVGCGVFVGLEREHHGKAGARTFGLAALLGCLGGLSGNGSAILSMAFLGVLVCFLNWRQLTLHQTLGLTTSTALLIVGFAGVFSGQGHNLHTGRGYYHYSCAARVETATQRLRRRIERS